MKSYQEQKFAYVASMNLEDKNLSLQFYDYLCDIVGSEEVVRTRRDIFIAKDISENTTNITLISSGSKAEGIDLKGSDYDQMILFNCIRVYESLNDVQSDQDRVPLVMDTNNTKPGFTKLKSVNKSALDTAGMIYDSGETVGEEEYISSQLFREIYLFPGMIIHGPCVSTPGGEFDYAKCLRCKEWITPAQQWIHRSHTTWPHDTLVTSAVQHGVLFVPIGCKNSPDEDFQWRISFSVTEKLLIHSFTHTQLLCYALMKTILKDIIKPRHGDLLCSYFLKTIMFWLSEEINPSEWKPENMISCFLDCIRRFVYCVEYKTCLHYFIPENNLFEDRFSDTEHKALLNTLRFIYKFPWIFVNGTSNFQNYKLESDNSYTMGLSASELSCYCYLSMTLVSFLSESIYSKIQRLVNVCLNEGICAYMLSVYARGVLQSFPLRNIMNRNKLFYKQNQILLSYFKISVRSFSMSSWLLLASLFYKCKRFKECLVLINYSLARCTPDMIHLKFTNSLIEQSEFRKMKQAYGLLLAFKHLTIENVCFRHPYCLLPDEITALKVEQCLLIPPVVYSYFLQFVCCHHLGNNRGKQNALHDLERTIRERYFILDTAANLRLVGAILDIVKALL